MKFLQRSFVPGLLYVFVFLLTVSAPSSGETLKVPVLFVNAKGGELCRFQAELAVTSGEQARGLMYRPYLPRKHGMLFLNARDDIQYYWMKNVSIPLDIIFMNESKEVVYVHFNAQPHDETTISSRYPARYILEINAGEARECKIGRGVRAAFRKCP